MEEKMPAVTTEGSGFTCVDSFISVRKVNAKKLASGYTRTKRMMEFCYFSVATYLWATNAIVVGRYLLWGGEASLSQLAWSPLMIVFAMVLSDFISGVAHWSFDTWGTPETLVFGSFIRSFREHHVNQVAMTKHDFIETNADTTLPLIPVLLLQRYFLSHSADSSSPSHYNVNDSSAGFHVFSLTLTLFIGMTNELHKWAHQPVPHAFARLLMSCRIVLTPKVHRRHHSGAYDRCYCITTGWLNAPLDRVDFWRKAEVAVTALTRAIPRANDREMLGVQQLEAAELEGVEQGAR